MSALFTRHPVSGNTIFQLFSCKDQTLLIGRDALFVLDLGLDIVDGIGGLDLKSDGWWPLVNVTKKVGKGAYSCQ
jgi:hypothetical protein